MTMILTRRTGLLLVPVLAVGMILGGCTTSLSGEPGKVLVAGATGQTGQLIVSELLASGYEVRALVRDATKGPRRQGRARAG